MLPRTPIASRCSRSSWGWRRANRHGATPNGRRVYQKRDDGRESLRAEAQKLRSAEGCLYHFIRHRRAQQIILIRLAQIGAGQDRVQTMKHRKVP